MQESEFELVKRELQEAREVWKQIVNEGETEGWSDIEISIAMSEYQRITMQMLRRDML